MTITPQRVTWQQYRKQLWQSLSKTEGSIPRVYSDGKGIPTIGVGYALVVGRPGSYKLRSTGPVPSVLKNKLTVADRTLLRRQVRLLNNQLTAQDRRYYQTTMVIHKGKQKSLWSIAELTTNRQTTPPGQPARPIRLDETQINNLARIAIPDVGGRSRTLKKGNLNRFSFTLSQGEPRQLFNEIITKFEKDLRTNIRKGHVRVPGVNAAAANRLAGALLTPPESDRRGRGHASREAIALVSLAYNGVRFPSTIKAALRGDRAEMYYEVVYRSNRGKIIGVADRRNHEGNFLLPRSWTDADHRQFVAMKRRHASVIEAYENHPRLTSLMRQGITNFGTLGRVGRGGRRRAPTPPRLSKFHPFQSRDIDAILFNANNPNNELRQLIQMGGMSGRTDLDPIRRAKAPMPDTPIALAQAGKPAPRRDKVPFEIFNTVLSSPGLVKKFTTMMFEDAVTKGLKNVSRIAREGGLAKAVGALQTGLNDLARRDAKAEGTGRSKAPPTAAAQPIKPASFQLPTLKVDGQFGPKTLMSLMATTVKAGPAKVEESVGVAQFRDFAAKARKTSDASGLAKAAETAFGRLLDPPPTRTTAGAPKPEATAIQKAINAIDFGAFARPLVEDRLIGPVTTQAFGDTMAKFDEDRFSEDFALTNGF